jgi:hypothetical protein
LAKAAGNDLPWNPAHRDIQSPLQVMLRSHVRPAQKAARSRCRCCASFSRPAIRRLAAGVIARCCYSARRHCGRGAPAAHSPRQDRPGGAGGRGRPAALATCRNLPGARARSVAGGGAAQGRAAVSKNHHRRRDRRHRAASLRRYGTGTAGRGGEVVLGQGVISNPSTLHRLSRPLPDRHYLSRRELCPAAKRGCARCPRQHRQGR